MAPFHLLIFIHGHYHCSFSVVNMMQSYYKLERWMIFIYLLSFIAWRVMREYHRLQMIEPSLIPNTEQTHY